MNLQCFAVKNKQRIATHPDMMVEVAGGGEASAAECAAVGVAVAAAAVGGRD
jgi:hypothetical protein